jgi:hypothetical protein
MKYRIGSVTIEAIDTYVRVTVCNIGGPGAKPRIKVTDRETPTSVEVAQVLAEIRGYWPDQAHLQICGRAADDARANAELVMIDDEKEG